ncbi:hypothetical protein BDW42DRAFT_177989 [Aspergillus taichungensis]|uniref:Secreted protein n=1 Tax=Aspergillus taichungensis TaxID=482145 RepID=A0A2J5HIL0_9EURO|nr:hypothetical protein BDW42DRAFT_177989 [Aspergillus taichungensis]
MLLILIGTVSGCGECRPCGVCLGIRPTQVHSREFGYVSVDSIRNNVRTASRLHCFFRKGSTLHTVMSFSRVVDPVMGGRLKLFRCLVALRFPMHSEIITVLVSSTL